MDQHTKEKIVENNRKITELLRENESLLRKAGYNPPFENYLCEERTERINFPAGYIRPVEFFIVKYHLRDIFLERNSRHNVTYALEVSDLMNFVFNRINIWGVVETIFYKLAIVNLVSVIEAIILEAANNICYDTSKCTRQKSCKYHFSKDERNRPKAAMEKLVEIGILDFDEKKLKRVHQIIELRNRIHIRLAKGNELKLDDFNMELYNEVIRLLQEIDEKIYEKAVPLYHCGILE